MKYLLFLFLFFSCSIHKKNSFLANTKWEYNVADGCVSSITFKSDGTYQEYNCERDYPFSGKFQINNDTIFLIEMDLASNLPEKKQNVVKGRSKYIFKNEYLKYVSWEDFKNNEWCNIIFPLSEIFYKKTVK